SLFEFLRRQSSCFCFIALRFARVLSWLVADLAAVPRPCPAGIIMPRALMALLPLLLCQMLPCAQAEGAAPADSFRQSIAPILARRCIGCHGETEPKGGLSLTTQTALLKGGESGPAIVAGKPDESLLVSYISGDKPAMPKDAAPLAAAEVAALREWIA